MLKRDQVVVAVRDLIRREGLASGSRLPGMRRLMSELKFSRATVLAGLRDLEAAGVVEARERRGYFTKVAAPRVAHAPKLGALRGKTALIHAHLHAVMTPGIWPLGRGEPSLDLLPADELGAALRAALRRSGRQEFGYAHPVGRAELRTELSRHARNWGCRLGADDLVITAGAMEAIELGIRATSEPGDAVAVQVPVFYGVWQAVELLGRRVVPIPARENTGLDLDALARALRETKRLRAIIVVPSFDNSLGACMPAEARSRLVALADKHNCAVIEDDVYGDLGHTAVRPACAKAVDERGIVLLCGGFSKTVAPGFRVGWIAPGLWRDRVVAIKAASTYTTPTLLQDTLAIFMREGGYKKALRGLGREYGRRVACFRSRLLAALPKACRVTNPGGGYSLWVTSDQIASIGAEKMAARALGEGFSLAPGALFFPKEGGEASLRLHAGHDWNDQTEHAVELLAAWLR
jgi:DNA-binding transcriptional MocR family regulator